MYWFDHCISIGCLWFFSSSFFLLCLFGFNTLVVVVGARVLLSRFALISWAWYEQRFYCVSNFLRVDPKLPKRTIDSGSEARTFLDSIFSVLSLIVLHLCIITVNIVPVWLLFSSVRWYKLRSVYILPCIHRLLSLCAQVDEHTTNARNILDIWHESEHIHIYLYENFSASPENFHFRVSLTIAFEMALHYAFADLNAWKIEIFGLENRVNHFSIKKKIPDRKKATFFIFILGERIWKSKKI